MMEPRPIHNEAERQTAMAEIARLWDATREADVQRLADWGELVNLYEVRRIAAARNLDPIAVIRAEMEMNGRTRADLAAVVGQNRASELLARTRALTLGQIRALHAQWGIPADLLIAAYETA